jgi:hypothetical protein
LLTLCNIYLFLNLINRFKKNHILFYIFFALNPALLLFSFYDLGGYARSETFGICVGLLHTVLAQKFYYNKINYIKYLKLSLTIIYPLSLVTILIHELNILFLFFHFFTTFLIVNKNKLKKISNFKYLIFLNLALLILIIFLLLSHPFTKEFAQELYNNLQNKNETSFWIWDSIALTFFERISTQISSMHGSIFLYFFIFLFYFTPILFLLCSTSEKNNFYIIYIICSSVPFFFLFFIGIDWGRWIHIIIFIIFLCLIQFKEKKLNYPKNYKYKMIACLFIIYVIFQFVFTRIPHCCNLVRLNLNLFGGMIPKIEIFYKIYNNNYDLKERFKTY